MKGYLKYPYWISWELTNKCNYHCIHCRMEKGKITCNDLEFKDIKRGIDELNDCGIFQINYSGGEPFLREDFLDIVQYTSSIGMKVGITTNGSLLTEDLVKKLKNVKNLDFIQVSLDGENAKTHDYIRGVNGAYNKAIEAIKILVNNKIRTGVVTTVMKYNISQIPNIVKLLLEMNVNVYGARRFMSIGFGAQSAQKLLVTPQEYKMHCEYWVQCMKKYSHKMDFIIEEPLLAIMKEKLPDNWITNGCQACNNYGAITTTGDIRPCIFVPISMGNIKFDSFKEVWNNSEMRKQIIYRKLKGKCGECSMKSQCGGCRAAAYLNSGDLFGEDAMCFK